MRVLLEDVDELLFRYRRFPEDKDSVHLALKNGGLRVASRVTLESLLEQAKQQENAYWIERLEHALAFLG